MSIPFLKQISWYLVIVMFLIGICPRLEAGMVPSSMIAESASDRVADLDTIQKVLEMKIVRERLEELGFTGEELGSRLHQLSDEQLHQLAVQIDDLKVGGNGLGVVIGILVVIILIIVILHLTGHKVLVTK